MSKLRERLKKQFQDEEFRNGYADESLNAYIATQIKVLREQRNLTQAKLAELAGMKQARIAVLENVNYSSWSITTLKRLAEAFRLRLSVKFEEFGDLLTEVETFSRERLEKRSFEDDPAFKDDLVDAAAVSASDKASNVTTATLAHTKSNVTAGRVLMSDERQPYLNFMYPIEVRPTITKPTRLKQKGTIAKVQADRSMTNPKAEPQENAA